MIQRSYIYILSLLISFLAVNQTAIAQCSVKNTFFDAGEVLVFDLSFKYGIIQKKAGFAKLATTNVVYGNQPAYKMTLTSATEGLARKLFSLNDTLSCYTTKDLRPLAYQKFAHEDGDYTKEVVNYNYSGSTLSIKSNRVKNGKLRFDETFNVKECTYDMMSVVFYARALDYSAMKVGDVSKIYYISGKKRNSMDIVYQGKETQKSGDGSTYNCIKLSLRIKEKAFEGKEAMKVYLTDDKNRMPVRMDVKLKKGESRAILRSYKGNKHPVTSKK